MNPPGGGEVQGSFSAVAGRDADPAPSIQVEPSVEAVCDPVVAGIDRHARNQIGNEQVEGAAAPLLARR